MFNPYAKAILAAMVAFLGSLATAWDDSHLTTTEIVTSVGIGIAALMGVWAAPHMVKWLVSGLLAGLASLAVALQDDKISAQEWITIASVTAAALGAIYATANTVASNVPSGPVTTT